MDLKQYSTDEIIKSTFMACNVDFNGVNLLSRKKECVMAKFIAAYLLRERKVNVDIIVDMLSYQDHAVVCHAHKVTKERILGNKGFEKYKNAYDETLELLFLGVCKPKPNYKVNYYHHTRNKL